MSFFSSKNKVILTPKQVQVIIGKVLHDVLGTYKFDSYSRKAIAINKRDPDATVSGLEVVIQGASMVKNREQKWGFFLLARDEGATDALYFATQILTREVRKGGFVKVFNQNYELTQFQQCYVEFPIGELYRLREELNVK